MVKSRGIFQYFRHEANGASSGGPASPPPPRHQPAVGPRPRRDAPRGRRPIRRRRRAAGVERHSSPHHRTRRPRGRVAGRRARPRRPRDAAQAPALLFGGWPKGARGPPPPASCALPASLATVPPVAVTAPSRADGGRCGRVPARVCRPLGANCIGGSHGRARRRRRARDADGGREPSRPRSAAPHHADKWLKCVCFLVVGFTFP